MINLAPDVEHQILENAARDGKEVNDYLRLILPQTPRSNGTTERLTPDDYPDEGKDRTDEDLAIDLAWAQNQNGNRNFAGGVERPREADPSYLMSLPKAERDRIMEAQAALVAPLYEAGLSPLEDEEWTEEEMQHELAQATGKLFAK